MQGMQVTEMSYEVVFTGELREGFSRRQGIDTLCHQFSLNFEQVKSLLSGGRRVIKKADELSRAERIIKLLWEGGWQAELYRGADLVLRMGEMQGQLEGGAEEGGTRSSATEVDAGTEEGGGPDMVNHSSADSAVSIAAPASWQLCSDLNPNALLQLGCRESHHYMVVLRQARAELPGGLSLEQYAAAQLQECAARVSAGALLSGPEEIDHPLQRARASEMAAQLGEVSIQYLIAHFQGVDNFYTLFLWCDQREFEMQKPVFNRVVSSLSVKDSPNREEEIGTIVQISPQEA